MHPVVLELQISYSRLFLYSINTAYHLSRKLFVIMSLFLIPQKLFYNSILLIDWKLTSKCDYIAAYSNCLSTLKTSLLQGLFTAICEGCATQQHIVVPIYSTKYYIDKYNVIYCKAKKIVLFFIVNRLSMYFQHFVS